MIENRGFQDSLDGTITEQQFEENLGKEFQGIEFQGYNSDGTFTADPQLSGTSDPQLANTATAVQLSDKEIADRKLYGQYGQTPNAAETAQLTEVMSYLNNEKMTKEFQAEMVAQITKDMNARDATASEINKAVADYKKGQPCRRRH